MKPRLKSKLEKLRDEYAQLTGQPFVNFYCPILYKDEDMPVCEAHIVNKAFRNSSRAWTVQRSDVEQEHTARIGGYAPVLGLDVEG